MKRLIEVVVLVAVVMLAGCGSDGTSEPTTQSRGEEPANEAADPLEGTWHTEFTCPEMVRALKRAGAPKPSARGIQDEFGLEQQPSHKNPCAGVDVTSDHTLRFEGGHFALFGGEELGWEASYELIDENTFVIEPTEGGVTITFDFRVEDDTLYTDMVKPAKAGPHVAPGLIVGTVAIWETAPWEREN
jgi:hypothetical protein